MNGVATLLGSPVVLKLGLALVHFLWEGLAAAVVAALALVVLRKASAGVRYVALLAVLVLMAATPVATYFVMSAAPKPAMAGFLLARASARSTPETLPVVLPNVAAPAAKLATRAMPLESLKPFATLPLSGLLVWVVLVWAAGVVLLSLRLIAGWRSMGEAKSTAAEVVGEWWRLALETLVQRLRVVRVVRLLESAAVQVPTVVGWLRPAILLPATALTGLSPEQWKAILAHELAHIRRNDYLVNLGQTVIETLLFYHPGVWWVSGRIRAERELCCDDLAVEACGNAMVYAGALASLEEQRAVPEPAVSAGGGSLVRRVRRLVRAREVRRSHLSPRLAGAVALLLLAAWGTGAGLASRTSGRHSSENGVRDDGRTMAAVRPGYLRFVLELRSRRSAPPAGAGKSYQEKRPPIGDEELAETGRILRERIAGYGLPDPAIGYERTSGDREVVHLTVDVPCESLDDHAYAALAALLTTPGELRFLAVPRAYASGHEGPLLTQKDDRMTFTFREPDGREITAARVIAESQQVVGSGDFEPDAAAVSRPGEPTVVSVRLRAGARSAFEEFTRENAGSYMAMVLDGEMIACPLIRAAIPGRLSIASSSFDGPEGQERARELAIMVDSGPLPLEVTIFATAGDTKHALKALSPLKSREPYGDFSYLTALGNATAYALNAGQPDAAAELLAGFEAYPVCDQAPRLSVARALREEGAPERAAQVLQHSIRLDPFSREAPESLELLADILQSDLGRADEGQAVRRRLAGSYFPSIPSVARAIAALGTAMPETPREKMVLLDSTLMESSTYDRCPTGSCNFGQYEVLRTLTDAGYVVHETRDCITLTRQIMDRYGLVVMNGRYGGVGEPPMPADLVRELADYVTSGGSLLVIAGGKALGEGHEPQFYNPLLSQFGLRFAEGVTLPYQHMAGRVADHPAMAGLTGFHWEHGVPLVVMKGESLGYAGGQVVIASDRYGRGRVVAAGLGSGFMGQCLNASLHRDRQDIAAANKALLLRLVAYAARPAS